MFVYLLFFRFDLKFYFLFYFHMKSCTFATHREQFFDALSTNKFTRHEI